MSLPNPQRLEMDLVVEEIDGFKKYDCTRYDTCLNAAMRRGWPQFHCNDCTVYEPLPLDHPSRRLFARAGRKLFKSDPEE